MKYSEYMICLDLSGSKFSPIPWKMARTVHEEVILYQIICLQENNIPLALTFDYF